MQTQAPNEKAYLIIARFSYEKWKALATDEPLSIQDAEQAAEKLFPDEELSKDLFSKGNPPIPYRPGVKHVHTFRSDIFTNPDLPMGYSELSPVQKIAILDPIYANKRPKPPVGWMVVLDASDFASFVEDMCTYGGHLWRMFDVEILPLNDGWTTDDVYGRVPAVNDDQTTSDIYLSMTVRNWS